MYYNNNENHYQTIADGAKMVGRPWLHARFRNAGFRLTLPRQAILNVFARNPKHLSAEEIFLSVHRNYPGIGLATVYRTLDLLTQMGLVFRFDFGDGRSRYELASEATKEHHHHMVCTRCGQIIDYSDFMKKEIKFIKELEVELSKKHKFKISTHQIHFYGSCNRCQ
jgi:Fur family ferric uptake transcriptional regulator